MIFAVDINNGHQWTIIDNNGQQSAVLHASLVPFLAVHNSSIGDLITDSLTDSLTVLLLLTLQRDL